MAAQCSTLVGGVQAAEGPALYRPRRSAQTVLYRLVQGRLESYLALARAGDDPDFDPVPQLVERAFRRYLESGILAQLCTGALLRVRP